MKKVKDLHVPRLCDVQGGCHRDCSIRGVTSLLEDSKQQVFWMFFMDLGRYFSPTLLASGCELAAIPCSDMATERRELNVSMDMMLVAVFGGSLLG